MKKACCASALCVFGMMSAASAAPGLPPVFSDHMVVQRGEAIPVWGTASPGAEVTVSLGDVASGTATAGEDGAFRLDLSPQKVGGPYKLTVAEGRQKVTLDDVMVGDVFLCSGQSNMAWPLNMALNPHREVPAANDPLIRLYQVPETARTLPASEIPGPPVWQVTTPETAGGFSAVCYLTAKELRPYLPEDLALGLVHSSWGGSQIEAWLPTEYLATLGGNERELSLLAEYNQDPAAANRGLGVTVEKWWADARPSGPTPFAVSPGAADWKPVPAGLGDYNLWADEELAGFTGTIWYRGVVTLTESQAKQSATLLLGAADDVDYTWVNGEFVGTTFGWGDKRTYSVPAGILKEGENILVSGVYNSWGAGGLTGPETDIGLKLADGTLVKSGADWEYWVTPAGVSPPPRGPWESVSGLTTLYNGMIAPLGPIRVRAALWYQGESNADHRAGIYKDQLLALAKSWREQFGEDVPVFIAQLPGFGQLGTGTEESSWARLRESQRLAALEDPLMELVVLIDAGNRWDIHPPNKQVVGRRMAEHIREAVYGEKIEAGGPVPTTAERHRRRKVIVSFDRTGDGLMAASGLVGPFTVCDGSGCEPAPAALRDEKTVELTIPAGSEAQVIRYCWGDAPLCTLYDKDGDPVGPFELSLE